MADLLGARQGTVRMSSFDAAASRLLEGLSDCLHDFCHSECALYKAPVRLEFGRRADGAETFDDLDVMDMYRLKQRIV